MSSSPPGPTDNTCGIYRQIIGREFDSIGLPLQQFLDHVGSISAAGTFDVRRRRGLLGLLLGAACGFPRTGYCVPLTLIVERTPSGETWKRDFAGQKLITHHTKRGSYLVERIGPVKIHHTLTVDGQSLVHESERTYFFGLPLPRHLSPGIRAVGTPADGGWLVSVDVAFPLIGSVLQYSGRVEVVK